MRSPSSSSTQRRLLDLSLALDLAIDLDPVRARTSLGARPDLPRLSPASFALAVSPGFLLPPHIDLLDRAIVETIEVGARLIVEMPPRHGKSELGSRYTPAWFLGTYSGRRVMLCSAEGELATGFGRRARDLLLEHGQSVFGVRVRSDSAAADRWDIAGWNGGMLAAGIGGSITGRGADLLIIDDPVKSVEDAESATMRERTWEWYCGTALTRLEPGAAVIVIMTRWHEDDLGGRILDNDRGEWRVLRLPALAEEDDPLGRAPGEPLWPERYSVDELERRKRDVGRRVFAAEYQQRPVPPVGTIFQSDWFRYARPLAEGAYDVGGRVVAVADCRRFVACDLALSTRVSADWTVITCWLITPANDLILVDVLRRRMQAPEIVPALRRVYEQFEPYAIGIETGGFQSAIIQEALLDGLPAKKLEPDKDKVSRALLAAAKMESGKIFFRFGADYLEALEPELLAFPHGRHDDQVDAISYAAGEVALHGGDWRGIYGHRFCPNCDHAYRATEAPVCCAECGEVLARDPGGENEPSPTLSLPPNQPAAFLGRLMAIGATVSRIG